MAEPAPPALRVRDHAILAALVAGAWGTVEGWRIGTPAALALCVALLVLAGALVGLVQAGVLAALRGLWRRARSEWPAPPDDEPQRHRTRATVLAACLCSALALAGLWLVVGRLQALPDPDLGVALTLLAAALACLAVVLATPFVAGFLLVPSREFVRSLDWPFPERPEARRFAYIALPIGLAIVLLQRQYAAGLQPYAFELGVILLLVAESAALAFFTDSQPAPAPNPAGPPAPNPAGPPAPNPAGPPAPTPAGPPAPRASGPAARPWLQRHAGRLLAGLLALALAIVALAPDDRKLHAQVARRTAAGGVHRLVRDWTDLDGDSASSLLGGGDCAALDATRGPHAHDIPGNRIDEDCDGADAWPWQRGAPALEPFHGHLDPAMVRNYNVVWIIVDAMRFNHLSAFGYRKPTTPYLEHLAGESLVFHNAYSQSSATMLSIPSMFAGRPVGSMSFDREKNNLRARNVGDPLATLLRRRGYRTGFIVENYLTTRLPGVLEGFETVDSWSVDHPPRDRLAATTITHAIQFLERDPDRSRPFFLALYLVDPHSSYMEHPQVRSFGRGAVARYDNELAYVDQNIGFFVEYMRAKPGLLDDTIVVIAADHGEEFDDHGGTQHSRTCHEESVHVPLFVRVPGLPAAAVDLRVGLNDIVPTLVELIGLDVPPGTLDGQSLLVPALTPERAPADRPIYCTVVSQKASQGHFIRHGVRAGDHVLLQDVLQRTYDLYDLSADKREKRPLDPDDPAVRQRTTELTRILRDHISGNIESTPLTK